MHTTLLLTNGAGKRQTSNSYALNHSADPIKSRELSQREPRFCEITRYFSYRGLFFGAHLCMCVWISSCAGLGWVFF